MTSIELNAIECGIPDYMIDGISLYLERGVPPGDFLTAVICNDLKGAVGKADCTNIELLKNYVQFFYWHVPSVAWGSPEKMQAWIDERTTIKEPA